MAPRLMLDNNIWTFLVAFDAIEALQLEAWSNRVDIVIPPAVVIEALQANPQSDEVRETQRRRIRAMTSAAWVRLMPEAFKEANEVRHEVERLRPQWINPRPQLGGWNHHRTDWESAWWDFVRNETDEAARLHRELSAVTLQRARADSRRSRDEAREQRRTIEQVDFVESSVVLSEERAPDGDPFDSWRGEAMNRWFAALHEKGPNNDWLAPWVLRSSIEQGDWVRFWTRDVDRDRVPLNWLRWAFGHVQATQSTGSGTPGDNQIATYLPESDTFVTADAGFGRCIQAIRPYSPVALAEAVIVGAGEAAVDAVFNQIVVLRSR